jgi:hypothetical protein
MNIVYLIGNGFDLNLGMKTGYQHFYEHYTDLPSDNDPDVVKHFKEELRKDADREKWSDLELSLGDYLKNLDEQEAITLHDHLIKHLSKYLESEENNYVFNGTQKSKFFEYLIKPQMGGRFPFDDVTEIDKYISIFKNSNWDIKLITFNYTRSIEKLLGIEESLDGVNPNVQIEIRPNRCRTNLSAIEHIHGFTQKRMILGVDNISQIINDDFRTNIDILERYVKTDCNNTYKLGHDKKCQQWIKDASLICLFGLSFGYTDKKWWNLVGNALQKDRKVIIFEHVRENELPDPNQGAEGSKMERMVKDRLLSKTNIEEDSREKVKKNIFVAHNTNMFEFNIEKMNASNGKNGDISHP